MGMEEERGRVRMEEEEEMGHCTGERRWCRGIERRGSRDGVGREEETG